MGERRLAEKVVVKAVATACRETIDTMVEPADEAMRVQTPGGVFSVRWDERGSATALGQLAFFAEYLETSGLFEAWLESCPLSYTRPHAPALVDVLGCWRARRGAGLQRVALVRAAGSSEDAAGGDHEPAQVAQRGRTHDPPCRSEENLADHHALSRGTDQAALRQCSRRAEPCSRDRAAVG